MDEYTSRELIEKIIVKLPKQYKNKSYLKANFITSLILDQCVRTRSGGQLQKDLESRIASYNKLETELDPAKQINDIPILDMPKLNPIFDDYCKDGEKFFSNGA